MTLSLRRYDNPLRPAYEGVAATCWTLSAVLMFVIVMVTPLPRFALATMGMISIGMAAVRWRQTLKRWDYKINLAGKPFAFMRAVMLVRLMSAKPQDMWMGFGFNWSRLHTQRASEMRKYDEDEVLPPMWFRKLRGADHVAQPVGKPWIHAVGGKEEQVYVPLSSVEGHTIIFGTTGAGKTRMFEILITQAVVRGEVVIVIDPKGDKELRDIMQRACLLANRPNAFIEFRPAFPQTSIRLDPLANWNNVTEIASRIASLMPSEGGDSFVQMAWKAVHVVAEGMIYCDQMPNLMKLRRYIEGGAERLMEEVLRTFLARNVPRWETLVAPIIQRAREGKLPTKMQGSAELLGYIHFYKTEVPEASREPSVDGLMAMVEHNREHLGKILASLIPLLVQLTAGELGKMLSPDPTDLSDARPIFNSRKVIEGGHVLYMGLDSLSNATVGAALGSITLADLTAVAGSRYNYGGESSRKIQLFVDEVNEAANVPLIQILNKARGAGFVATLATQTFPDLIARLGDEAKARQMLGNCNNLIALRTIDRLTQDFITETFGKTKIQTLSRSLGLGSETESTGIDYRTTHTQQMSEEEADLFAPELLGMLPNLHYVAKMAGGRIIKGRLPKLTYAGAS